MANPIIQKNGSVSGPSGGGEGSNDLAPGETVDLANLEPSHAGLPHFWEFVDSPLGTAPVMIDEATETPSFVVDPDPLLAGSYEVKCTVNGIEFSTEIFAKPLTNTGARIPAHKEQTQYDKDGNTRGWQEAETVFKRTVDALLGETQASITERQGVVTVPLGGSSQEIELGGVVYPGSALAISGKLERAVTSGSVTLNLKVNGVTKLTTALSTAAPTFAAQIEDPGVHGILLSDVLTVEIVGFGYANADVLDSELVITSVLSSNLGNAPVTVPDASISQKGVAKLSVAPAIPSEPVAVGTNDTRLPDQNENDALQGTSGVPSNANRYVTNSDARLSDARTPTGHAIGGASHTASTLAEINSKISDATLDDTSGTRDPNAHDLAGAEHNSATLAQLNAKISDATLDDSSATRDPNAHDLAGAQHNSATLAQFNAKISDATLDDSSATRDPNAHALGGAAHSADTLANVNTKVSDATLAATDVEQSYTKSQRASVVALTDGANVAYDASASNIYELVATNIGTRQLDNPSNLAKGMTWQIWFIQDGTDGGEALTFDTFYDFGAEGTPDFTAQGVGVENIITCVALSTTKIRATTLLGA